MPEFMNDPKLVLGTMADVQSALATQTRKDPFGLSGLDQFRVKSTWLVELIEEIAASEYPYNATVKRAAEQRMGMPTKSDAEYAKEGDVLSLLIYNAQQFRHSDNLKRDGYQPFTEAVLESAYAGGKVIEVLGTGFLGNSVTRQLKPRVVSGKLYAMVPKKQKQHVAPMGQPVKLVEAQGK